MEQDRKRLIESQKMQIENIAKENAENLMKMQK